MKGKVSRSDRGVVSLMVTIILMLVISMIVLGFAQISRREQRQTLDRQLSTQAFLAAESGINDARTAMQIAVQAGKTIPDKTECDNTGVGGPSNPFSTLVHTPGKGYVIDASSNVAYTCLLVNTKLADIHEVVTSDGPSSTIPLHPLGGTIQTLHIVWNVADQAVTPNVNGCDGAVQPFTASNNWSCPYGVLRMDMVPTDNGKLNRQTLLANQKAVFFYPNKNVGAQQIAYGSMKGRVQPMRCDNVSCKVDITGINDGTNYSIKLSSIYQDGTVDIKADGAGGPLQLTDAQAQIDSTGKAQDVLRRVQVRISLATINDSPKYGLESGSSICKRFMIQNNIFVQGSTLLNDATNPMCQAAFGP